MKYKLIIILFLVSSKSFLYSQVIQDSTVEMSLDSVLRLTKSIQSDTNFNLNYYQLNKFYRKQEKEERSSKEVVFLDSAKVILNVFFKSQDVVTNLYNYEASNHSNEVLTQKTIKVLHSYTDLKSLAALLKVIDNQNFQFNTHKQVTRKKLIHAISVQMQILSENAMPLYNYPTVEKRWLKGVQIESANDLFRAGFIQKNNDMDYTGALKVSLITDLLKLDAFKPTQSYQMLTYGGEVYTPYFKDTNVFIKDDTFNVFDRPHACFQYFGIENHGVSEKFISRWSTNIRVGLMGSRFGFNFQYFLHKDISISPSPTGWNAQIGFPGRLAAQLNVTYERLFFKHHASINTPLKFHVFPFWSTEVSVGHFMTYWALGGSLSTQNFKHKNQINILPKSVNKVNKNKIRKMMPYADFNVSARYVIHNSTLAGFGVVRPIEKKPGAFADESLYYLEKERVIPVVLFTHLSGGFQFANFNFFYRSSLKSPEYRSAGKIFTQNNEELDPAKRWHHYASVGVSFIL